MTQYSRHPSGFCRREQFIAGAKADPRDAADGAGGALRRMAAGRSGAGAGAIIAAQATSMNYLSVQEAVLRQQCDEETAALQINAELARQCALLCSMLHNEQ